MSSKLRLLSAYANNKESIELRFWAHVEKQNIADCWIWTASLRSTGYGQMNIARYPEKAHRISFLINFGWLPTMVIHSCDNRVCVNPAHLRAGTAAENQADSARKWRTSGKITRKIRNEVYTLRATGLSHREIGQRLDLAHSTVGRILRREIRVAP